jgi:putative tryptophan/tyrosine transport system substrate-binding protein
VNRRALIAALVAAAAWPQIRRARAKTRRRIGALMDTDATNIEGAKRIAAFRQELQQLGWTEGGNIEIDLRWGGGDLERTRAYARELVDLKPDVIFAYAAAQLAALARETRTIPIVFVGASAAAEDGYVASFAHPGGNITGFTQYEASMAGRWLEMLKRVAPDLSRVGMVLNPTTATMHGLFYQHAFDAAAASLDVKPITQFVESAGAIETTLGEFAREPRGGLIVAPETFTTAHRKLLIALTARLRLPAIYGLSQFPASGGLMSYGPDTIDTVRRAVIYVDRVLRGENPAELPVQAPTKFELVINLGTAKDLGVSIPPSLLAQADEVIE